ncbi:MAG: Crp/Fnr family transcriptional regulator [Chthoniobacterales bacterium]|nr:Crp/Fnr family transcriptional regulator [Chthoniobacterales bacterium]
MTLRSKPKNGFRNRLLNGLPPPALRRLRKHLKEVTLSRRDSLHEPGKPFRFVYFPETAMASLLTVLKDGTQTEVASIGREGMVGLPAFLGAKRSARRAICQMPGTAWRLSAAELVRQTHRGGPLSDLLHRYAQALFTQMAQLATCNRLHTIEQRCCCWLLMTHDRVEGDEFYVTHEFLSEMLGARRSGVTVIAGTLQRAGLISYTRGRVTILDRRGLEKAACECYAIVRREFDSLLRA